MNETDKSANNLLGRQAVTSLSRRRLLKTSAAATTSVLYRCRPATEDAITVGARRAVLTPPTSIADEAWANVRAQFLLEPEVAYMNNASLGMPPAQVVESVHAGYEAISREPLHGKHNLQASIAEEVHPGFATLFGVTSGEIALTRNATEALHLQSVGLELAPGDEVLVRTQEHPSEIDRLVEALSPVA